MYKCLNCGNERFFEEINTVRTALDGGKKLDERFIQCDDVVCSVCKSSLSDGKIINKR